jgi:hypothetical protein
VNLVCEEREQNIEHKFGKHLNVSAGRSFRRATWETALSFLKQNAPNSVETRRLEDYMLEKTAGYDAGGKIRRAFQMP